MAAAAGEQRQGEPRGGGGEQRQDEPRGGGSGGASHEVAVAAGQTAWWRWRQRWFFYIFQFFCRVSVPKKHSAKSLPSAR